MIAISQRCRRNMPRTSRTPLHPPSCSTRNGAWAWRTGASGPLWT